MGANASTAVPLYASGQVLDAARLNLTNAGIPVFSGTATRDAAFGGSGEKVLAEGQFAYLEDTNSVQYYDSAAWQSVSSAPSVAIFNETQANNTSAGTFTSGSYVKRVLNTTVVNQITGCTLTSSVISLPAGTYKVFSTAPAMQVSRHQTRLRNTTDSTDIALGSSEFSNSAIDDGCTISNIQTVFTLTATKNIELQHRCETTENTFGLGLASNFGNNEIYTQITITKLS